MAVRHRTAALSALFSVVAILFGMLLARSAGTADALDPSGGPTTFAATLAHLDLDGLQRERIEALIAAEKPRVARFREAFADSNEALRRAELEQPFDDALVSSLLAQQGELASYARGVESRVVASIAALLTPAQRGRFAALRLGRTEQVANFDRR